MASTMEIGAFGGENNFSGTFWAWVGEKTRRGPAPTVSQYRTRFGEHATKAGYVAWKYLFAHFVHLGSGCRGSQAEELFSRALFCTGRRPQIDPDPDSLSFGDGSPPAGVAGGA